MVSASKERTLVMAILSEGWLRVRFFCSFFRCFTGLNDVSTGDGMVGVEVIDMTVGRRLAKVGTLGSVLRDLRILGRWCNSDDIVPNSCSGGRATTGGARNVCGTAEAIFAI